jgi:thymidylate synthase (FAD)
MKAEFFPYDGDLLVVNAARGSFGVAYDQWSDTPRGPRTRSDPDLMADLVAEPDNPHELPFRHVHVSLRCEAPLPVARQLGKHQVGFDWSEISRRYKVRDITFHMIEQWRQAPQDRRQGSGPDLPEPINLLLRQLQERNVARCMDDYQTALGLGATPEQARFLLPQSMNVLWVWTGSLLGWANLIKKRSHPDTQKETRDFVAEVARIMAERVPHAWKALTGGHP